MWPAAGSTRWPSRNTMMSLASGLTDTDSSGWDKEALCSPCPPGMVPGDHHFIVALWYFIAACIDILRLCWGRIVRLGGRRVQHCVGGAWHTVIRTDTGENYMVGCILPVGELP